MNYPTSLIIETSTVCNMKCAMCTHSSPDFDSGRPKTFLPESLIDKMSTFIKSAKEVQLTGIGEPLISPSFWKILAMVQKDCYVHVNSNFLNISDYRINDLALSNLKCLTVSIDSPDVDTYYKIRGEDLNRVINNVKRLLLAIKETKSQLSVTLNMTLMKENINQITKALDLCNEIKCTGLATWPLNNNPVFNKLNKEIRGWNFIYENQLPWKFKELYNQKIQEAIEYAKKLNLVFTYYFI